MENKEDEKREASDLKMNFTFCTKGAAPLFPKMSPDVYKLKPPKNIILSLALCCNLCKDKAAGDIQHLAPVEARGRPTPAGPPCALHKDPKALNHKHTTTHLVLTGSTNRT